MGKKRINKFLYDMTHKKKKMRKNNDTNSVTSNIELLNYEHEYENSVTTNISRPSFSRRSMIYTMQREKSYGMLLTNTLYLDLGDCTYKCQYCGAFFWFNERCNESKPLKYNLCCKNGKIKLPLLKETPAVLNNLLSYYGGPESTYYRKNIRIFNSMLAFTSFGANIDSSTSDSNGPHIFKISGQVHHLLGSLLPVDNNPPRFAQLYIYDTENEIQNRMSTFSFEEPSKIMTEKIIENLIKMLDETNALVKLFRTIRDRYKERNIPLIKLRLIGRRNSDSSQYDLPTSNDIGGLIVGDIGEYEKGRDIIIESRSNNLQRITKLHPSYMSLQYPLLFPYGEDGYRTDLNWNIDNRNEQCSRKRISMRAFYCYQLQQRQNQGNTLFKSGRLFQQYLVDAYASVEEDRLDYIRKNQKTLRSEIYQGIQDAITKGDTDANAIGKRVIPPSSHIRSSFKSH